MSLKPDQCFIQQEKVRFSQFCMRTQTHRKEFSKPAFARQLIELPNGAYKTNLFIALANINSEKWFNSCEKALPAQYSLSFGELIFHACLVAKKQKIVNELLKFAERLFLSIANGGSKFSLYGQLWKAKLSALKPDFQLNRGDFMLSKDNFSTLARIAYEHTQQELLLPSYRANAQDYLNLTGVFRILRGVWEV